MRKIFGFHSELGPIRTGSLSGSIFLNHLEPKQDAKVSELLSKVSKRCTPVYSVDVGMDVVQEFMGIN